MATTTDLEQTGRDANILHNYLDGEPPLRPASEYGRLGQLILRLIEELGSGTLLQYDGRVDTYDDLPDTGQLNHFYLVGPEDSQEFDEYFWVQPEGETGHWDKLGSVTIIIDDHLDANSTNPVQNGIITNTLVRIFSTSTTFHKDELMYYPIDGKLYKCNVTDAVGSFTPASWSEVTNIADYIAANYKAEVGIKNNNHGEIFNDYANNTASGSYSHAEGYGGTASGANAHAEGAETTASNAEAHAEGFRTTASGENSHAEGGNTVARGANSHAQNDGTIANGNAQTALGKFNVADSNSTYAVIIGCGTDDSHRANLLTVDWSGNININGLGSTVKFNNSDLFLTASMVDSSLNTASVRPVQNQAVANALNNKVDTSTFNNTITNLGNNLNRAINSVYSTLNSKKANGTALAPAYDPEGSYSAGDYVTSDGELYKYDSSGSFPPTPNLFNATAAKTGTGYQDNTAYFGTGTQTNPSSYITSNIAIEESTAYALKIFTNWQTTANVKAAAFFNSSGTEIGTRLEFTTEEPSTVDTISFTSPANAAYIRLCISKSGESSTELTKVVTAKFTKTTVTDELDDVKTALDGKVTEGTGYAVINGTNFYVGPTVPTGNVPENSIGIGF